jgi:hypothetical protein
VTHRGKLVEKKESGPSCECKKMCTTNFSNEEKECIIAQIYRGQPKTERDTYLMGLTERHDVAKH